MRDSLGSGSLRLESKLILMIPIEKEFPYFWIQNSLTKFERKRRNINWSGLIRENFIVFFLFDKQNQPVAPVTRINEVRLQGVRCKILKLLYIHILNILLTDFVRESIFRASLSRIKGIGDVHDIILIDELEGLYPAPVQE